MVIDQIKWALDHYGGLTDQSGTTVPWRAAPMCSDCPPVGYQTDKTRCDVCPRRPTPAAEGG